MRVSLKWLIGLVYSCSDFYTSLQKLGYLSYQLQLPSRISRSMDFCLGTLLQQTASNICSRSGVGVGGVGVG